MCVSIVLFEGDCQVPRNQITVCISRMYSNVFQTIKPNLGLDLIPPAEVEGCRALDEQLVDIFLEEVTHRVLDGSSEPATPEGAID